MVGKVKQAARIGAVMRAIGVGENRASELLSGRARRIDAWEKEKAKADVEKLRERERLARENEHLGWLECEIARLRATGEEFHGEHVDALVHLLRVARGEAGAVAVRAEGADVSAAPAAEI